MTSDKSLPTDPLSAQGDPLEAVVVRGRSSAVAILERHRLTAAEARQVLVEAVQSLESPHGLVPGAEHRLVRAVGAAARRIRSDHPCRGSEAVDHQHVFDEVLESVRSRRQAVEEARDAARPWIEKLSAEDRGADREDPPRDLDRELVVGLLDRARELWKSDPRLSLQVARRALEIASRFAGNCPSRRYMVDLEARAHGYAGNALRLLYDYRHADRELETAQAILANGTLDPRERAQILMLLSLLRRDQRRFPEALRQLQQAAAIYHWTRERHLEGTILMTMATIHAYAGRPELAIPLGERARGLLDPQRDPRLSAGLEKNMAHYLCAADRPEEARRQIQLARRSLERLGTPTDLRQVRWIEGQIALGLGERREGERLLQEVRDELVALGDSYDAALVSLELVAHYLDLGRTADAKRLAAESLPIFQSLEIHRETLAALIALQRATEMETATAGVVRELLERLRRGNASAPPRPEKPS